METPAKNRQKYRKTVKNNNKPEKAGKISKNRQKCRKTDKKPSKISKNCSKMSKKREKTIKNN